MFTHEDTLKQEIEQLQMLALALLRRVPDEQILISEGELMGLMDEVKRGPGFQVFREIGPNPGWRIRTTPVEYVEEIIEPTAIIDPPKPRRFG
jgi:hypothetical protein